MGRMPNGGSDNCATCRHNSRNATGAGPLVADLPCDCLLRGVRVADPLFTYCANHPHHSPAPLPFPVGAVYAAGAPAGLAFPERRVLFESPDRPEVREGLLGLLERMREAPSRDYPSPTRFEDEVLRQLGRFGERRAVPGLRRVLRFPPLARSEGHEGHPGEVLVAGELLMDRQSTLGAALEALARILGPEALPDIEPFAVKGRERPGLPLESYEKLARLRHGAVLALALLGGAARPALEKAAADPVPYVAAAARDALKGETP